MCKSLLQTVNESTQAVELNGIITPGSTIRRFGCNCRLNGNSIELNGEGYYTVNANVTVTPTAIGPVQVALYSNGVQIPGAIATGEVATAGNSVTLPLLCTLRKGCCSNEAGSFTVVLLQGPGTVSNIAIRVEKV